jgi:SPP1 gp7 family putative phage head morphogenesis protein
MDYGERVAEQAIAKIFRKLTKIYKQAEKDLRKKLDVFTARYVALDKANQAKVAAGEMTKKDYRKWLQGSVFIGKLWKNKVNQVSKVLTNANDQATKIINNIRFSVFSENYNHQSYEIEKNISGVVSFDIYNTDAVARLVKERPKMLPAYKVDQQKDYLWNRQKVEDIITQGIIQGESIDKITARMMDGLCTQNENKMRMFARTAMTAAQNAGRLQQMKDAKKKGVKVKKRWVATLDERTRDSHQALDGDTIDVEERFANGLMYPGDPNGAAKEVFNCRCKIIQIFEGINRVVSRRAYTTYKDGRRESYIVNDMTYKQWKEWKENGGHSR